MKRRGFELWQLLAVLAILFVIALILFPFFGTRRDHAPRVSCLSNEKQLGLAISQYVQDNDEQMPNIADAKNAKITWRNMIYDYAKSSRMYQCPSRTDFSNGPDGLPKSFAANYTGNYNHSKGDQGNGSFAGIGAKPIALAEIEHPESLIMLCEYWHNDGPDFNIDNLGRFNPASDSLWAGHDNGSNYLIADGHAKYFPPLATKDLWHRNTSIPLSPGALKVLQNAHLGKEKR